MGQCDHTVYINIDNSSWRRWLIGPCRSGDSWGICTAPEQGGENFDLPFTAMHKSQALQVWVGSPSAILCLRSSSRR